MVVYVVVRLCFLCTPRYIYALIISANVYNVLAAASSTEADLCSELIDNFNAASKVGQLIAERAIAAGVTKVAFDRSGFKYHGRVKALADAARENGLEF